MNSSILIDYIANDMGCIGNVIAIMRIPQEDSVLRDLRNDGVASGKVASGEWRVAK